MRPPLFSSIGRIGIRPDEPDDGADAFIGPRPRGSRRPHTDAKVAKVRRLIEETHADLWRDRHAHRRRPRQHLPLDARRRMAAAGVRAARDRHGAAPARGRRS